MVLCNVECVQKISEYLGLTSCKVYMSENNVVATDDLIKNQTIEGFSTMIQAFLKSAKNPAFLAGKDDVERALTRQWLEYAVLCLNYGDTPINGRRVLKELNGALQGNTYVCGTNLTMADVVLYYALHSTMNEYSTRQEKDRFALCFFWIFVDPVKSIPKDNYLDNDALRELNQMALSSVYRQDT